ncbi:methionine aminotransferase [Maribacter sp. 2307ULW6-5]|uniref:methionine aminotransferase n=1 Tax=Maribacter sp. 2307ULW6-5 TaxID=3386275 RepID=UPI0039BD09EC
MKSIEPKLPEVGTTIFTKMGALARQYNAVDLSQGFPNFAPNGELLSLVTDAMKKGHNQYAPMQGILPLRERISEKIAARHAHHYHPETEITVTAGATQALFTAIMAFVHPGEEVVVLEPAFDCYAPAITLAGGKMVPVPLDTQDFGVPWKRLAESLTAKTRMVIINSPHNPSGRVLNRSDMEQLQTLLKGTDVLLLSDEVYEHMVFDGADHESACRFPDLAQRSLICASFGKTFHVTGWKLGYMAGPKELMDIFNKVHQFNVFCVNHPMQWAVANYLGSPKAYLELNRFYQEKRDYFLEAVAPSRFTAVPSQGTYFQVMDYRALTGEPDLDFAVRLIKEHRLATIPLSVFNHNGREHGKLRFCFAKTTETLDRAADIINAITA